MTFCDENVTSLIFVRVTHSNPGLGSGIFSARNDADNGRKERRKERKKKNVWSSISVLLPTDGTSSPSLATVHPLSRKFQFSANERPANCSDKCAVLRLCVLISTCHPLASLLEENMRLAGAGSRPRSVELCHSPQRHLPCTTPLTQPRSRKGSTPLLSNTAFFAGIARTPLDDGLENSHSSPSFVSKLFTPELNQVQFVKSTLLWGFPHSRLHRM